MHAYIQQIHRYLSTQTDRQKAREAAARPERDGGDAGATGMAR